eukprot:scaffold6807_cov220-Amphora_coffeaeformis.AAC.2
MSTTVWSDERVASLLGTDAPLSQPRLDGLHEKPKLRSDTNGRPKTSDWELGDTTHIIITNSAAERSRPPAHHTRKIRRLKAVLLTADTTKTNSAWLSFIHTHRCLRLRRNSKKTLSSVQLPFVFRTYRHKTF